ncbi:hypothetical protein C2W62_33760 [Candidatus Entotheonella serta]|nr:hypothetical protein C2W62_33760 [Candidatus Entotheonella serta]
MRCFAMMLLTLIALGGPVVADNLITDVEALKRGVGVSFNLAEVPQRGATLAFRYYLAPRAI